MSDGNTFDPKRILDVRVNRRVLTKGAIAGAAVLTIPSTVRPGGTVAANKAINVLAPQWPQVPTEQKIVGKFAQQSGIAVTIDASQYSFLEQQIKQLVSSKSKQYDIYDYDSQWIGGFVKIGALERLDTPAYLGKSDASIKFDDFFPELTYRLAKYPTREKDLVAGNFAAFKDTPIYGLPWSINAQALWWRTDLIDAAPETWDDLRAKAKAATKNGVFGMAFQGSRDADYITSDFLPILWGNGGELWNPETYTAEGFVDSPDAITALKQMSDMVNVDKSVDPASGNWTINERLAALLQGKTAMCLNWAPLFGGIADDPKLSLVAGKIKYALSPKGPKGQGAMYGCQGTGINAHSEHKAEAWQYMQWLASKETQQAIMDDAAAGFQSPRQDLKNASKYAWQQTFVQMIPTVRDFWNIPEYAPLLDNLQTELNLAYVGRQTAEEALKHAAVAEQAIYDNSPDKPKK